LCHITFVLADNYNNLEFKVRTTHTFRSNINEVFWPWCMVPCCWFV